VFISCKLGVLLP